jgi:hypothetical protein
MKKFIKRLLCIHDYEMIGDYPEYPKDMKKGDSVSFSAEHECKKCGKRIMIGSGTMH